MSENTTSAGRNQNDESSHKNTRDVTLDATSRRRLLYILGAGGVVGLAGCTGTDQGADQQAEQSSKSATIALDRDPTEGDEAYLYGGVDQLNSMPMHERLVAEDPDLEIVPRLATKWEMIDATTWEFTIREGVKFHNGVPLTAEIAADSLGQEGIYYGGDSITKDSFNAVDKQTLQVKTTEPDPFVPQTMTSNNMKLQYRGDEGGEGPIGTGPFEVAESVTKGKPVNLTAFDNYWSDSPALDELVFKGITDDQTRALSLEKGEVDVAIQLPQTRYESFQESDEIVVKTKNMRRTLYILMSGYKSPTDETKVRLALHWLIDQGTIVESFMEDVGTPAVGPFSPVLPWAISEDIPSYGPDMERAQELVEESNYDGEELSLAVTGGKSIHKQIAERVQQKASNIGLNIKVLVIEPASMWSKFWNGEFNLWLNGFSSTDPTNIYVLVHSEGLMNQSMKKKEGTGTTSPPNVELDPLIEEAISTFDKEKRNELVAEIQRRMMEGGTVLPLVHSEHIFGKRAAISGPAEIYPDPWYQEWSTLDRK